VFNKENGKILTEIVEFWSNYFKDNLPLMENFW
jgi:hypothetical protein